MRGVIRSVAGDEQYRFRGIILGEDGKEYRFNSENWADHSVELADLQVGRTVEFERKPPNKNGNVYPKQIRFPGAGGGPAQNEGAQAAHSHGRFKDFVYMKTDAVSLALEVLVPGFSTSEYAEPAALYRQIATQFNRLSDQDFQFFDAQGQPAATFPIGFSDGQGRPISLYCTAGKEGGNAPWYAQRVYVDGEVYGPWVFDLVNANWYDVEESVGKLAPRHSWTAKELIRGIEKRCFHAAHSIVPLLKGEPCPLDQADELYVPTGICEPGGQEIFLMCTRRGGSYGYGWYFQCATYAGAPITIFEKKNWLEKWAGPMSYDLFRQLADQTLEEQWSFGNRSDFGILKNYLRYTFSHQWISGNIGYSADGKYAAFNTGLPDRNTYKYLYALFEAAQPAGREEPHPFDGGPSYTFLEFVVPGRGGNGKVLSQNIRPLPNPPQYFAARSATVWELDFNDSNQVTMPEYDDTHILIQRCERIPLDFYRFPAMQSAKLREILDGPKPAGEKYKAIREYFRPIVDHEPDQEVTIVYRTLVNSLASVIETAVKKLSWNWRAVVPCYNPERTEPCYLLPVSFCDPTRPDRAMIASVSGSSGGSTYYTIHTVIPLDWAYLDARLVCRPESEWLAANCIQEDED